MVRKLRKGSKDWYYFFISVVENCWYSGIQVLFMKWKKLTSTSFRCWFHYLLKLFCHLPKNIWNSFRISILDPVFSFKTLFSGPQKGIKSSGFHLLKDSEETLIIHKQRLRCRVTTTRATGLNVWHFSHHFRVGWTLFYRNRG